MYYETHLLKLIKILMITIIMVNLLHMGRIKNYYQDILGIMIETPVCIISAQVKLDFL